MSTHDTCYGCGGAIVGIGRIILDGAAYHSACLPLRAPPSDGGPAFPTTAPHVLPGGNGVTFAADAKGMTLRDWMAGQAIAGLTTLLPVDSKLDDHMRRIDTLARNAYRIADAMLKAREGKE